MRKIDKIGPLSSFSSHISKSKPRNWDDLGTSIKQEARAYILSKEQGGLSAYTERVVSESKTLHIDHFRKKGIFPHLTFAWNNLLVDERSENYGAVFKDKHIKRASDYNQIIDPIVDDPQEYFEYSVDGSIIPKQGLSPSAKAKAEKTIEVFNLNHSSLVQERKTHYEIIMNIYKGGLTTADILPKTKDGSPFPSLTKYICSQPKL